mmetsp:Transcript_21057/g.32608  ORF Transcript_21057/g.32608 Transcript_21057/m.32608 type:complete len:242 (-) Transcript_21057:325-1050(-)
MNIHNQTSLVIFSDFEALTEQLLIKFGLVDVGWHSRLDVSPSHRSVAVHLHRGVSRLKHELSEGKVFGRVVGASFFESSLPVLGSVNSHHSELKLYCLAGKLEESRVGGEGKLQVVLSWLKLGEDGAVVVFLLRADQGLVIIRALLLVKNQLEVEVAMNGGNHSEHRGLLKLEPDLVGPVVPKVVNAVALREVEVPLLGVGTLQEMRRVERLRELRHWALKHLSLLLHLVWSSSFKRLCRH